jgi:hypothetical protein
VTSSASTTVAKQQAAGARTTSVSAVAGTKVNVQVREAQQNRTLLCSAPYNCCYRSRSFTFVVALHMPQLD